MRVAHLRFEHHTDPTGIGEAAPRLSWHTSEPQVAYEISVDEGCGTVRSTGRTDADQTVLVAWPTTPLRSRERRTVRVRAWADADDIPSPWSDPITVETGLLGPGDWTARPVAPEPDAPAALPRPAMLLRRGFTLRAPVASARLYATAHGLYEIELNGTRVGDHVLAPGWSSYHHRLRYQTFDVTDLLHPGDNALGAWLADGWYRGRIGFGGGRRDVYGQRTALLAQLEIIYPDGGTETVGTDPHWRSGPSPITATGLYEGEHHDARLEHPGWSHPGFDDTTWSGVLIEDWDLGRLVAPTGPPVRHTEILRPVAVSTAPSGATIVDFGQNIAGRLRITAAGTAGQRIRLRHAEVLEDGDLCVRPLRTATATDGYTLGDEPGPHEWEPRFTIHGFRYAEITGDARLDPHTDVQAVVIHTDAEAAGSFACSDPLIDQLHANIRWSLRGNLVDLPTDCPQRDERLGWTGDIQVFAPTAAYLYHCTGTLASWLRDLAAEQGRYGTVPHYVPWIPLGLPLTPAAAWGDAAVLVPWTLYRHTGDTEILRTQYPSMKAWVDQIAALAGDDHRWTSGFQFGDWLDPTAPPDRPDQARTDPYLVATAYHAHTAGLLAEVAAILGLAEDHRRYTALAAAVRAAFDADYLTPTGRLAGDTQTGYALAIQFHLIPGAEQRERAGRRLVELVRAADHRIATGFVGTPLICDALSSVGAHDTAYQLLAQQECPSWIYPVTMGATTIWERWDSLLPDGRVNPGDMTSFNHYALGAVADWLHRVVGGLAPAAPGYRRLLVAPRPGGGLTTAATSHDTPYGRAAVRWTRDGQRLTVEVDVPAGTTAEVRLPDPATGPVELGAGGHRLHCTFRAPAEDPSPQH